MDRPEFTALRQTLAAAFGTGGEAYERLRPSYPGAAVDWLLAGVPAAGTVADVGAGTGKLTESLIDRRADVVAIDPSADMLAQLSRRLPTVRWVVGSGEATTLEPTSVDLVTFAQAWHWVDPVAGVAELVRVLKPGGRVGMVWNFVDVRVGWVAELAEAWHSLSTPEETDASRQRPELGDDFDDVESVTVDWSVPMALPDLASLVGTRSYYLTAGVAQQAEIRARVSELIAARFPGGEPVQLPYRTHCFRATVR